MANWVRNASHWGAFDAKVEGGRVTEVRPVATDPDPSEILHAIPGMNDHATRVLRPSARRSWLEGGPGPANGLRGREDFVEISWAEALDRLAAEITRIRDTHGNEALFTGSYGWSSAGRFHHAKSQMQRFYNLIGGSSTQVHTYSFAAAQALLPHLLGSDQALVGPISSWDGLEAETRVMLCFGGIPLKNAQVEAGGCGEHTARPWLQRMKAKGVRFINVSPLRADMEPELDAEWLPTIPGTDTALILGLCHHLLVNGLHDRAFLDRYTVGFDRFAAYLLGETDGTPKTVTWAAAICGLPAERLTRLAEELVRERSMITMAWALQRAEHGEQPYWAAITLASMVGQIGLQGGGFAFGYGAEAGMGNPRRNGSIPTFPIGKNPCASFIPVARIADMLLAPGESYQWNGQDLRYPDARLIHWVGGNPFHHHQDLSRLSEAFQRPDTIVVNEHWWTATARHADLVLPASTTLEREDIAAARRDRFYFPMRKAVAPMGEARSDHDIFADLAARFDLRETFTEGLTPRDWMVRLWDEAKVASAAKGLDLPDFNTFWAGEGFALPLPERPFTLFEEFRADPETHRLQTPSGRIEIFSDRIAGFGYEDCPGHATWIEPSARLGRLPAGYPLHLVSNQPKTRLHSQMDATGPSLESKIAGREPAAIHPAEAAKRGLKDGDIIEVFNERGCILAGLMLDEGVMPGILQLSTGAWYDPDAAGRDRHGNPNVLTRDIGTSRLSQGCSAHSCMVEIRAPQTPPEPVQVHVPPKVSPLRP